MTMYLSNRNVRPAGYAAAEFIDDAPMNDFGPAERPDRFDSKRSEHPDHEQTLDQRPEPRITDPGG